MGASVDFYGVGYRGGTHKAYDGNTQKLEFTTWHNMLKRCYSDNYRKYAMAYGCCEVSENFKSYDYFYDWCRNQVGFGLKGHALDKDLLKRGNKKYSEDNCVFIPHEINSALILRKSKRGSNPIGVSYLKQDKKYAATLTMFGEHINVGYFNSKEEAFFRYKEVKELYLKSLANMHKLTIDERAYFALLNYEVDIND